MVLEIGGDQPLGRKRMPAAEAWWWWAHGLLPVQHGNHLLHVLCVDGCTNRCCRGSKYSIYIVFFFELRTRPNPISTETGGQSTVHMHAAISIDVTVRVIPSLLFYHTPLSPYVCGKRDKCMSQTRLVYAYVTNDTDTRKKKT
jgi:hypothetical protein